MKRFARWFFMFTHKTELVTLAIEVTIDKGSESPIAHEHALGVIDALTTLTLLADR